MNNRGARSEGLSRGLEILCLFADTDSPWGISDLARHMQLHKSQVHRAVKTLEDKGFLRRSRRSGKYSLGWRAYEIGLAAGRKIGVVPEIRASMKELAEKTGATVSFRVLDGIEIIVMECVEGNGLLRVASPLGTRLPWCFSAGGKLLSAFSSQDWVERMIRRYGLARFTENTIVSESAYLEELKRIREQGFALSEGEGVQGVFSVAAPIFEPTGELMAALQAALPAVDLSPGRFSGFVSAVVRKASEISLLVATRNTRPSTGPRFESPVLEMQA